MVYFFKFVSTLLVEFRSMLLLDLMHNKNNIQVIGIKIVIAGRLKGKSRADYEIFQIGSLRQTSYSVDIQFGRYAVHTGYGVYGIHSWVTYKKPSDLTLEGSRVLIGGFKFGQIKGVKSYLQSVARYVLKEKIKKKMMEKKLEKKRAKRYERKTLYENRRKANRKFYPNKKSDKGGYSGKNYDPKLNKNKENNFEPNINIIPEGLVVKN